MEAARSGTHDGDGRFDGLRAEATAAVGSSANTLRTVRDRYREAYADLLKRTQGTRDGRQTEEIGDRQAELAKLELAQQTLERTWLFLERGDVTLVTDPGGPPTSGDIAMRIVEAQEAERARLAQEVHDGPAQALTNAIFQVEYIERVIPTDPRLAETELRFLRELLRRELGDVRAFISQLRPPLLDELGLDGAIMDTVERIRALTGLTITTELAGADRRPHRGRPDGRPARRPGGAPECPQARVGDDRHRDDRARGGAWVLEVADDGRGFDVGAVAARGRRNFGLQFMRERAELVGARFDVRSQPDGGTVVRLTIPTDPVTGVEEST